MYPRYEITSYSPTGTERYYADDLDAACDGARMALNADAATHAVVFDFVNGCDVFRVNA